MNKSISHVQLTIWNSYLCVPIRNIRLKTEYEFSPESVTMLALHLHPLKRKIISLMMHHRNHLTINRSLMKKLFANSFIINGRFVCPQMQKVFSSDSDLSLIVTMVHHK
jgi:hypothetical protein